MVSHVNGMSAQRCGQRNLAQLAVLRIVMGMLLVHLHRGGHVHTVHVQSRLRRHHAKACQQQRCCQLNDEWI